MQVLATLPTSDQVLSMTKRPKLSITPGASPMMLAAASLNAAIPTPVIHQPIHGVVSPPPPGHQTPSSQSQGHVEPSGYEPPDYHHRHHHHHHHGHTPYAVLPYHHAYQQEAVSLGYEQNALNLSNRSRARSPYDVSSGSGGEEELRAPPSTSPPSSPPRAPSTGGDSPASATSSSAVAADSSNNSLPLKLRHKSHLGDKDQAASALLALHNIKQEPVVIGQTNVSQRASSTPPWDGEGSSDERDSGISLGAEWTPAPHDNKQRLHSEIVRLSTEVANLKSLVIRTNN